MIFLKIDNMIMEIFLIFFLGENLIVNLIIFVPEKGFLSYYQMATQPCRKNIIYRELEIFCTWQRRMLLKNAISFLRTFNYKFFLRFSKVNSSFFNPFQIALR